MAKYIADNIFRTYDVAAGEVTTVLDLSTKNVFKVDASAPVTVEFTNLPSADRDKTIKVYISGDSALTISNTILWNRDVQPTLEANWTLLVFSCDGNTIYGNKWGGV